ncbi:MAG: hypothetical protein LBG80_19715 [Bacteroidales bacterium]|jgi:transposase|nr:hypothetical protein [Bacteroidales bacterium]
MTTVRIKEVELPAFPPVGWKKEVAEKAGVSEKTVYSAIRRGTKGPQSAKVWETYKALYGKPVKVEIDK